MKMKMSWMGLVLGLVLLMAVSSDATDGPNQPVNCCYQFATFKIPESEILEIVPTDSHCPVPGYVLSRSNSRHSQRETRAELQTPAEKMKMSWMGLVLGLVLLMAVSSDATLGGSEHPVNCCFQFRTFKIPESEILEIVKLDSHCPVPGYVLHVGGRHSEYGTSAPQELMGQFYTVTRESDITSSITVWGSSATKQDTHRLQRIISSAGKNTGGKLPTLLDPHSSRTITITDPSHPGHHLFHLAGAVAKGVCVRMCRK
ncbi:hypothetical protein NFI96_028258 [Prochilodus magdalenae]|nr:hypothetical protein NFI96_028258 [Prochilodus magdalenae]